MSTRKPDLRMVDVGAGERIIVMNERSLQRFIGWCEAHRPPGDWEPGFLQGCLSALERADEGYRLDATAECAACGEESPLQLADVFFRRDGEWYCADPAACNVRRLAAEAGIAAAGAAAS